MRNPHHTYEYIYGAHAVKALLATKPHKISIIYLARKKIDSTFAEILHAAKEAGIMLQTASKQDLDLLVSKACHQGIVAKMRMAYAKNYEENDLDILLDSLNVPPFLLILDGIQDPHNLGACLRVANAAGVNAVIAPKDRAVDITPAVYKVAAGAVENTPYIPVTNLARTMRKLKERGIWLYGAIADAKVSIYSLKLKGASAIVLGGEERGLRHLTRESCDFLVSIPMLGTITSLNVSVAAGVLLFEAVRQKLT